MNDPEPPIIVDARPNRFSVCRQADWPTILRPLGLALALAAAGYAQSLADARQHEIRALALYFIGALVFALVSWERLPYLQRAEPSARLQIRSKYLWWALLFGALTFASVGDNHLSVQGLVPWVLAVVLCFPAFPAERPHPSLEADAPCETNVAPRAWSWQLSWPAMALLGATLVGAWMRLYRLPELPADLGWDLPYNYFDVQGIVRGETLVFFPANMGREGLFFYLAAGVARLGQLSPYSIRLTSALVGIATVPAAYLLAKECLDREAGLYAAWLLALNKWHLVLSRSGYRVSLMPLLVILALYGLARGLRRGSARGWCWCGLFTGLGLWSYKAFVFVLPVVLGSACLYVLMRPRTRPDGSGCAERWDPSARTMLVGCAVWLLVTAITCAPLVRYAVDQPDTYLARELLAQEIVSSAAGGLSRSTMLYQNTITSLLMFNYIGDGNSRFNVPFQRHLGFVSGLLLVFGLAAALTAPRRRGHALLIVSLLGLLVPMTVTMVAHEMPNCFRSAGTIGPAVALGALALQRIRMLLARALAPISHLRLRGTPGCGTRARRRSLSGGAALALLAPLVAGLFLLAEWRETEGFYFHDLAQYAPDQANYSIALEISKTIADYRNGPAFIKVWPHWFDGRALAVHLDASGNAPPVELTTLEPDQYPLSNRYERALFVLHPDDVAGLNALEAAYARWATVRHHFPDGRVAFVACYVQR